MTTQSKKVLEKALALPEQVRTEVVEHLLNSIEHPPALTDDELRAVVARRPAEIDKGKVEPVTWDEVKKRVRANEDSRTQQFTGWIPTKDLDYGCCASEERRRILAQ